MIVEKCLVCSDGRYLIKFLVEFVNLSAIWDEAWTLSLRCLTQSKSVEPD